MCRAGDVYGEDRRLAIDIAAIKQALFEDGGNWLVRWVPGNDHMADDLIKLMGNSRLMQAIAEVLAGQPRSQGASRKRGCAKAARQEEAEQLRQRG